LLSKIVADAPEAGIFSTAMLIQYSGQSAYQQVSRTSCRRAGPSVEASFQSGCAISWSSTNRAIAYLSADDLIVEGMLAVFCAAKMQPVEILSYPRL